MATKQLTIKPWKEIVGGTTVPDKGLQKALADYKGLPKEKRAEQLKAITSITKLVTELKKVPAISGNPSAAKYLTEVAGVLEANRLEINKANAEATLEVTIQNDTISDDLIMTIDDLNKGRDQTIVDRKRLNKKTSMSITLTADGSGKGQIFWLAVQADDAASKREDTVKGISDGQTVKVRV